MRRDRSLGEVLGGIREVPRVRGYVGLLYMRRVIVASGCSRSFGIFFVLIGKVCRGVRRVREEGFEDFFQISKNGGFS